MNIKESENMEAGFSLVKMAFQAMKGEPASTAGQYCEHWIWWVLEHSEP